MKKMVLVMMLLVLTLHAYAEEPLPLAFIFNFSSALTPLESYQGGVGMKLLTEPVDYRFMLDIYHSQQSETSNYSLGVTVEKHLTETFISPYFGMAAKVSYLVYQETANSDNWLRETIIPIEAGPVFGVEVFATEYLSLFAEYYLSFAYKTTTETESIGGTETTVEDAYITVDAGIGNGAKIGLTIYFDPQVTLED